MFNLGLLSVFGLFAAVRSLDEALLDYDYSMVEKGMYDEIAMLDNNEGSDDYNYFHYETANDDDNEEIKHGREASQHEYPSIVHIGNCGGSIISPHYVITASHCISHNKQRVTVVAGEHVRGQKEGNEQTVTGTAYWHPWYRGSNTIWVSGYDIAIIFLDKALTFNKYVNRIALAKTVEETIPRTGDHLVLAGWGSMTNGYNGALTLMEIEMQMISDAECKRHFRINANIDKQIYCMKAIDQRQGAGACNGDSGGPAYLFRKDGTVRQVGISSFVIRGCSGYSAYAEVPYFFNWIAGSTRLSANYLSQPVKLAYQAPKAARPAPRPAPRPVPAPRPAPTPTPTCKDRLYANQFLRANQKICSRNGKYFAIMQSDANFVVYQKGVRPIWASHTWRKCSSIGVKFIFQSDMNAVIYCGRHPIWASHTYRRGNPRYFVMQDDGNLVAYSTQRAVWSSKHGRV